MKDAAGGRVDPSGPLQHASESDKSILRERVVKGMLVRPVGFDPCQGARVRFLLGSRGCGFASLSILQAGIWVPHSQMQTR